MKRHRKESIGEMIRAELSRLIIEELRDPRLGFITVTGVDLSPDLGHARIFVSVLGESSDREQTLEVLTRATGYFRKSLSQSLNLRRTPELKFLFDATGETGARIDRILDKNNPGSH